ncbi:cytochrome P450 oxidoreductase [Apiospora hydei]|uniref:Cytochrome P450 oxidoreductase n=1 Tax=Apiospora hydei TaxID=1337664 RepID=A0ABR1UYA2_9PEZI
MRLYETTELDVRYDHDMFVPLTHKDSKVLRTVYTPESNALFPAAIAKLERWIRQYYVHKTRFSLWGEKGEASHKPDGCINAELGRRLRFDVVQDAGAELDIPRIRDASRADIERVCDVFGRWVAGQGGDVDVECQRNPRFRDFLVVDEEVLRSLLALPDETSPLRVAVDSAQKREWRGAGFAFLWIFEPWFIRHSAPYTIETSFCYDHSWVLTRRGWMKIEAEDLDDLWFYRFQRSNKEEEHLASKEQEIDGVKDHWYDSIAYPSGIEHLAAQRAAREDLPDGNMDDSSLSS